MNADPLSLELTLELARRARHTHRAVAGGCELCRVPWPCEAAERIEDTITVLEGPPPRAVGRVRVEELRDWGTR